MGIEVRDESEPAVPGELETLREIEGLVRTFVAYVDEHVGAARGRGSSHSPFAPRTIETVEKLHRPLSQLDKARRRRSAKS